MKRVFVGFLVVALCIGIAGCSTTPKTPPATPRASGDYNGVYSGELTTLNYLVTSTTAEYAIAANCVDGLVECDNLGIIKPSLATSWSVSPDGLTWTFKLRQGVKWLTWDKKEYAETVAQDWVDAHKYAFTPANASSTANIAYEVLKNGTEYYEGKVTDFAQVGVKATDKYTLVYTLKKPVPYFLTMLTYVSFLPAPAKYLAAVGDKFGTDNKNLLYNGAYIMSTWEPQNLRVMEKNDKYWDAGNVHIKKLNYKFNKEASTLGPELFLRGEISGAGIPTALLDDWMKDPAKKAMIRPVETSFFSYFYAFNFDPHFDKEFEPDNWKVAVNNANFRKAVFNALDRKAAMTTAEPYNPSKRISNTVTPKNFVAVGGKDFTQMGGLATITARDSFNKAEAVKFRDLAKTELKGKATFPIKAMMPFNAGSSDWTARAQVVEQQIEGVLGADFIDIIPVSFPATNFLGTTRRAGNYAIQECNWGPDYADPETYTDPFFPVGTYNWPEKATGYNEANGKCKYENLVAAAKAEVTDMTKRYTLFADAEAFLINEAFLVPYGIGGGGYQASKLEPFTYPYAPFGMSDLKFKGQIVMAKPMGTEEYNTKYAEWEKARAAALQQAATTK
ncbi:MAG: peptide ABC transporter substrate-binding protein [Bacillota bacterium]